MVDYPPSPPSDIEINGHPEENGLATKAVGHVSFSAVLNDPEGKSCRLAVFYADNSKFQGQRYIRSNPVASGKRAQVSLTGLGTNKQWWAKAYALDAAGNRSTNYNGANWWMARRPLAPTLVVPAENATIDSTLDIPFNWTPHDPDPGEGQAGFELQFRKSQIPQSPPGAWQTISRPNVKDSNWTIPGGTFAGATFYDWTVRTKDVHGLWGPWAPFRSFYALGVTTPPILLSPVDGQAVIVDQPIPFTWRFKSPIAGAQQIKADLRYQVDGAGDTWTTMLGEEDPNDPGSSGSWTIPEDVLGPDLAYNWQVRTYDDQGNPPSDWTDSQTFNTILTPGGGIGDPPIDDPNFAVHSLGCGAYRVFVYDRGGQVQRGEITPFSSLTFNRVRDDISDFSLTITGWNDDCGQLLSSVHCWANEIVVFRNKERVWEGPITLIEYSADSVSIQAKDVMAYLYRRILRQGYNDAYRVIDGQQQGLLKVTERAQLLIMNALAVNDPNVLPYLSAFIFDDDAKESRIIPDYSQTVWEQVDDLAAVAGLDYTVIGRRIMLWDTHRAIGRLPEMTDGDFGDNVIVTEYGMQLCNYSAVTDGNGLWAAVRPTDEPFKNAYFGPVEMVASAYGERALGGSQSEESREQAQEAMKDQARRNINGRWPTPMEVRVPDNTTLSPDLSISFEQLVPGVWIPVTSKSTLRDVSQWQKLNLVTVTISGDGPEQITVTMQPAPNAGQDPDGSDGDGGEDSSDSGIGGYSVSEG